MQNLTFYCWATFGRWWSASSYSLCRILVILEFLAEKLIIGGHIELTIHTRTSIPNICPASASDEPH